MTAGGSGHGKPSINNSQPGVLANSPENLRVIKEKCAIFPKKGLIHKGRRFRFSGTLQGMAGFQASLKGKRMAKKVAKAAKISANNTGKPRSKSALFGSLAEATELSRKQVSAVFDGLAEMIKQDLKKGPGVFAVPGLMRIKVIRKPATKAREGINPFTGEKMMFKAKPARNVVKVQPLKGLKAMV